VGAQITPYTLIQLYLFRERQRVFEVMNDAAKGLSDDDLRSLSESMAKLPPPHPAEGADPARISWPPSWGKPLAHQRAKALMADRVCVAAAMLLLDLSSKPTFHQSRCLHPGRAGVFPDSCRRRVSQPISGSDSH
jgi:hypothetical protein